MSLRRRPAGVRRIRAARRTRIHRTLQRSVHLAAERDEHCNHLVGLSNPTQRGIAEDRVEFLVIVQRHGVDNVRDQAKLAALIRLNAGLESTPRSFSDDPRSATN